MLMRSRYIPVKMTPEEEAALKALAAVERRNRSEMIRELIREACKPHGLWPPAATSQGVKNGSK